MGRRARRRRLRAQPGPHRHRRPRLRRLRRDRGPGTRHPPPLRARRAEGVRGGPTAQAHGARADPRPGRTAPERHRQGGPRGPRQGGRARRGPRQPAKPPRTDRQRKLVEIWREVLGLSRVDLDDDFLDAGGDSLLAARLVAHLQTAFDVTVPVGTVLQYTTVEALDGHLEQLLGPSELMPGEK
ncbi:acyl carrier protein [Streptomyces roseicoloratus]|uniref:acyl carrier protein n=1 Tax=Streptomyces roseicoloratus TaxID=2508722 RepID=UPI0035A69194